jgi:HSP20 family protein
LHLLPYYQQNDKEWKVAVDLPGLKKDDIRIELDHGMLTIEAERSEDKQQKGETFTRQERTFGMVRRSLRLPDNVDPDKSKIKAKFDHGVLHVTIEKLPESAKTSSKKIEIQ